MEECFKQGIPTIEQAKLLLLEAQKLNHGDWIEHLNYRNILKKK